MSEVHKKGIYPQYHIYRIPSGVSYIRPSIMAFYDGYSGYKDSLFFRKQGLAWLNHIGRIRNEFQEYRQTEEYSLFCVDLEEHYNFGNEYFRHNLLNLIDVENDINGKDNKGKRYRPAVLELLELGKELNSYSLQDLLFYDDPFYKSCIPPKIKEKLEKRVIEFVNKYDVFGFINNSRTIERIELQEEYRKFNEEWIRKGYPVEYNSDEYKNEYLVETILWQIEEKLTNIIECFRSSGFAVDSPEIKTPALFSYKQKYYTSKDRYRPRESNTLKNASAVFDYEYLSNNKTVMSMFLPFMRPETYFGLLFPTHSDVFWGSLKGKQEQGFYSEPVSLFLYAAKAFYLQVMYVQQMFAQRRESGQVDILAEPKEIFQHFDLSKKRGDYNLKCYPTYDTLLQLAFDDITSGEHYILVCPWCGKVQVDRNISTGTIYCNSEFYESKDKKKNIRRSSVCETKANKRRSVINSNTPVEIDYDDKLIFRKAEKSEGFALLEFYKKHIGRANNRDIYEIQNYQTDDPIADLYVAECGDEIICLCILERVTEFHIKKGLAFLGRDFSLIPNKKYRHKNVLQFVGENIEKTTNTIVSTLYECDIDWFGTAFCTSNSEAVPIPQSTEKINTGFGRMRNIDNNIKDIVEINGQIDESKFDRIRGELTHTIMKLNRADSIRKDDMSDDYMNEETTPNVSEDGFYGFVAALTDKERDLIISLLNHKNIANIVNIELIVDSINEKALDSINDNLISFFDGQYAVIDDYINEMEDKL